jgi:hypothetical protein
VRYLALTTEQEERAIGQAWNVGATLEQVI